MSISFELTASIREDLGKGATRRLRRQDMVPAVIYGAGKEPVSITLAHNQLLHSTENEAFFSHILSIDVEGKKRRRYHQSVTATSSKKHFDACRLYAC